MKTGLVLEGGGMRGAYTCGVLDHFLDQDLMFDRVVGVSAGACHACSYLSKQRGRAIRISTQWLDDKRYMSLSSLVTSGDLFNVDFIYDKIPNELDLYNYSAFNNNPSRFFAVCTDCKTGKPLYMPIIHMQEDIQYIRASASLPLASRIVKEEDKAMLDGGISDSIPFQFLLDKGCDKVIVVLTRPKGYRKEANKLMPLLNKVYRNYPALLKALENRHLMYNQQLDALERYEKEGKVFCLYPSQMNIGRLEKDTDKLTQLYQTGYQDVERQKEALMAYLERTL